MYLDDQNIPLVTCIIPCYKKFDYLYQAIDSVLMQNYERIELLITDDGSPNFPKQDITEYINKNKKENIERVYVNHNEQNVGTVHNVNSMIAIAKGDYFINLACDDVFYDENVFYKVVERFTNTCVDFLSCSRLKCTENLTPLEILPTESDIQIIKTLDTAEKQFHSFVIFQYYNIASGSAMYYSRKNIARMGLFDERYKMWEDGPRITEYARRGNMIPTAFDIISIKYRDGGISNDKSKNFNQVESLAYDKLIYAKNVIIPDKNNPYKEKRRELLFWIFWDQSKNKFERFMCLIKYPQISVHIIIKKLLGKSIR